MDFQILLSTEDLVALLSWFNVIEFLPESQFGFRPGHSVSMALSIAQNDWISAKSKNYVVGLMAFDLSAAFDTLGKDSSRYGRNTHTDFC